jgi:hypothetical protein
LLYLLLAFPVGCTSFGRFALMGASFIHVGSISRDEFDVSPTRRTPLIGSATAAIRFSPFRNARFSGGGIAA